MAALFNLRDVDGIMDAMHDIEGKACARERKRLAEKIETDAIVSAKLLTALLDFEQANKPFSAGNVPMTHRDKIKAIIADWIRAQGDE